MVAKISNKAKLKTGSLQLQPVPKKVTAINNIAKKTVTSAQQITTTSNLSQVSSQNLAALSENKDAIAGALTQPNGASSTPKPGISSEALQSAFEAIKSPAVNKITAAQVENDKKTAYETLTNLSDKRPEIISLTNFSPLFDDIGKKTEQGRLFDLYVETMRQLETAASEAVKDNTLWSALTEKQNADIKKEIETVRDTAQSIYDILRRISVDRARLSLHDNIYRFSPQESANLFISADSISNLQKIKEILTWGGGKLGLAEVVSNITKIPKEITKSYSSTQLWLLLLHETKNLLESHSVLAIDGVSYQSASDAKSLPGRKPGQITLKRLQDSSNVVEKLNGLDGGNLQTLLTAYSTALEQTIDTESLSDTYDANEVATEVANEVGAAEEARQQLFNIRTGIEEVMISMDNAFLAFTPGNNGSASIALMLHLVCKELRHSSCYNSATDKLLKGIDRLSQGTGISPTQIPVYDFFGKQSEGFKFSDPGQATGNFRAGLTDLCYYDSSDTIVLTTEPEEIKESSNINIKSGGGFFYGQEKIIELTRNNSSNSFSNVAFISQLEDFSKKLNSLDEAFTSVSTELGLFSVNDEKVLSKDIKGDGIFSFDPQTFLENIFNELTKDLQKSAEEIYSNGNFLKNSDIGINALIKYAGSSDYRARSIRAVLFLMSIAINRNLEDFEYMDAALGGILKDVSSEKQSEDEILDDRNQIRSYILNASDGNFSENNLNTESFRFVLKNIYKDGSFSYLPCRYETDKRLGEAIRKNSTFKMITKIMGKVRDVFFAYSRQAVRDSSVGKINVYTILCLTFNALCKIVERTEVHEMSMIKLGTSTFSQTFLELAPLASAQTEASVKKVLKETGIISDSGSFKIELYTKINSIKQQDKKSIIKNDIFGKIFIETSFLNFSLLAVLNTIKTLKSQIESSLSTAKKLSPQKLRIMSSYMNDPVQLEFLLVEPQLTLLLSNVEDAYQNFKNFSDVVDQSPNDSKISYINYQETLAHSKKVVDILKSFFDNSEFKERKGYNKKILTIGLPQGLIKNHISRSNANSKNNKHDDIIKLLIYKIDLINNDIVYKPKSLLFEASRYPVRVPNLILSDTADFSQIPTRNYSFFYDTERQGESFYYSNDLGEEYDFLNAQEKLELIQNHSISFLLENYLKIVSGLVLNENAFNLTPNEAKLLLEELDSKSSTVIGARPLSPGPDTVVRVAEKLFPSTGRIIRQLVQPKKFDRIFNVIFDPEFIIDVDKSNSQKLDELIRTRKVVVLNQNNSSLVLKDVDKTQDDATLDAFFVVMETHAPVPTDKILNAKVDFKY